MRSGIETDAETPLSADEVLAAVTLTAPDVRGDGGLRLGLRHGRPLLYPLPADDLGRPLRSRAAATGHRYVGALFAFDLDEPPHGYHHATVRFSADLTGSGVTAVAVHSGGDQFGLVPDGAVTPMGVRVTEAARPGLAVRLGLRADRPAARTVGVHSARFGWHYAVPRTAAALPCTYATHAVLEVPAGVTEVSGTLGVEVDLAGLFRRRAGAADRTPVRLRIPGATSGRAAAVRLCMAADVVAYSRRGPTAAERIQRDLVRVLAAGRSAAGIGPADVDPQPQGDGQFTVLPVGLDEGEAIPRLIRGLAGALAARNAAVADDRMRLRVALHRGLVKQGDNGWVGRAAIAAHRLLDATPLRAALTEHPGADYVLGVPDVLYADVLATGDHPPPDAFRPVTVDLPDKGFLEQAWIYCPAAP
ncbi:hypothetical protein [Actinoplanes sp. NPDC049265]|uniref:hypothetical protein n=1 Tax=Actinoplanes sp. NPDC049265 TaxID=3363902 RepID=UPI00371C69C1